MVDHVILFEFYCQFIYITARRVGSIGSIGRELKPRPWRRRSSNIVNFPVLCACACVCVCVIGER